MPWPKVRITGGPHAKNTKLEMDGVPQGGLHHVNVAMDVRDAVRITLEYFVEHVEMEVQGVITHVVRLVGLEPPDGYVKQVATGEGLTIHAALLDLAEKVKEEGS